MNHTQLQYYDSYEALTVRFVDYGNVYVLTTTSLFGMLTNILCIIIICHLDKKDFMNKFMLAYSVLNFEFHLVNIFVGVIRCGALCAYGYTYGSKIYELYVYLFSQNVILLTCILLDLCISLNRLASFSNKTSLCLIIKKENFVRVFMSIFVVSIMVTCVCYLIPREVDKLGWLVLLNNNNNTNVSSVEYKALYQITPNMYGQMNSVKIFLFTLNVIRGSLLLVILFVLNVVVVYKYSTHLKRKELKFSNIKSEFRILCEV